MKCKKCSTPIIPGETRCRFCGSTMIINDNKEPEIIDIIDDIIEEKKPKKEPEIIDIIDEQPNNKKEIIGEQPKKIDIDVTDELEKTTQLERIDIEEFTGKINKEELKKIEKETTEKNEVVENEKPIVKNEIVVNENPVEKEEQKFNEKSNTYVVGGVLVSALVISLVFNLFLFLNRNLSKKSVSDSISEARIETFFNNYEISIPDNWQTKTEVDKDLLMIFDSTTEWAASLQILKDVDYKLVNKNADDIQKEYAKQNIIFTSNYTKTVNNIDYFLYKGKQENYSVYLILQEVDDSTVLATNLKFKGEIKKEVLDTILDSFSSVKGNNLNKLYESDFNFSQLGDVVTKFAKPETEIK